MKLQELQEWIKAHKNVAQDKNEYDDNGNHYETRIYADKEGRLFQIEFSNGHPYETWGKHGFIRGEYSEPREVIKRTRIEEYYEPKEDSGEIYV